MRYVEGVYTQFYLKFICKLNKTLKSLNHTVENSILKFVHEIPAHFFQVKWIHICCHNCHSCELVMDCRLPFHFGFQKAFFLSFDAGLITPIKLPLLIFFW
jgi:hypothetical protein